MKDVSFEDVKKIINSPGELTKEDFDLVLSYLEKMYLDGSIEIKIFYTDESCDMKFEYDKNGSAICVNYKYYLEKEKGSDKIKVIFNFMKSFLHEFTHLYRLINWLKNKNEAYNYAVESNVLVGYYESKGFDFYSINHDRLLMELEAEIKSALMMKDKIKSGEWDIFNTREFFGILDKQIVRNDFFSLVKPIVLKDCTYSVYDIGIIDILINIYSNDRKVFDKYPFLYEIINVNDDIVDMLLKYKKEPFDLRRYLIAYLAEEYIYRKENVLEHINKLTDEERSICLEVIAALRAKEESLINRILNLKGYIPYIFESEEVSTANEALKVNVDVRKNRLVLFDEFAKIISDNKKFNGVLE